MPSRKMLLFYTFLIAFAMLLTSFSVIPAAVAAQGNSGTQSAGPTGNLATQSISSSASALSSRAVSMLQNLHAKGIPNKDIYVPSFRGAAMSGSNVTGPSYTSAPAPFGIGTYGFSNNSGTITRYELSTSSFAGSVTFNNFATFYPLDDAPNSVTVQLNAVLNNVTLFGHTGYSFWNQNVLFFSARNHTVQFIDNVWNFSSPAFYMSPNVFSSYDGTLVSPYYYYAIGPVFNVSYPFTVQFYLNSTVLRGDNAVYFNYTLSEASGTVSGTYDTVVFNSTYGQTAGYSAPQANYLVTSTHLTPTGFIPYDAEIMIGGPGGGSTAMIYQLDATMTLQYLDQSSGAYSNVPSAYDVGSETGETATGAAVTWTQNAVAKLTAGPSFVYGMWNVSAVQTFQQYSGQVTPPNSFMFVSQGSSFDGPNSTWSPLSLTGSYSFSLPTGEYNTLILMSNYDPMGALMTPGTSQTFSLSFDVSQGVYTPLYAFDNSQLLYISSSGSGTVAQPYVLFNNAPSSGQLNSLFSTFNDYLFPEFQGVILHSTNDYVMMSQMPSFEVSYLQPFQLFALSYFGIVYTQDQLGFVLYNTQNATLTDSHISGWFPDTLSEFPVANVLLWNSQNDVITGNYFDTMDSSLLIFDFAGMDGFNLVSENFFIQDSSLNEYNFPGISVSTTFGTSPYGPVAITVYSSNNQIHDNYVVVYDTAVSPFYSIYTGYYATYVNNWNGNFWWNYVPSGMVPYNNNGQIFVGGDYDPIVIHALSPGFFTHLVTDFKHR